MRPIKDINAALTALFFTTAFLSVPIPAHAAWSDAGMHPVNVAPPRVIVHNIPPVVNRPQALRAQSPVNHPETVLRHETQAPHVYHNLIFDKHFEDHFIYISASPASVVPDDLEEVVVDGQTYFYSEGAFYQQVGDQLVAIGAVVGAVVDYLPPDYQMVMADGINYFVWGGVYYERLAQGFEVVVPPDA